ncbi:MAG: hypothetical protein JXR76_24315 [Deltaproteobacteria bacterium]|nr:hypothetical protein [Deltaproteobacteria bacterium]
MKRWSFLFCFLVACSGAPTQPNQPTSLGADGDSSASGDTASPESQSADVPAEPPKATPITSVSRPELDGILDKGPGHLLAMVQTDSVKENGRFVGFRIVGFRLNAPAILGIQPGDIVVAINGMPVERPEHLIALFKQLRTAASIKFSIIRDGKNEIAQTPVD